MTYFKVVLKYLVAKREGISMIGRGSSLERSIFSRRFRGKTGDSKKKETDMLKGVTEKAVPVIAPGI